MLFALLEVRNSETNPARNIVFFSPHASIGGKGRDATDLATRTRRFFDQKLQTLVLGPLSRPQELFYVEDVGGRTQNIN